jgi:hypothetical protein
MLQWNPPVQLIYANNNKKYIVSLLLLLLFSLAKLPWRKILIYSFTLEGLFPILSAIQFKKFLLTLQAHLFFFTYVQSIYEPFCLSLSGW